MARSDDQARESQVSLKQGRGLVKKYLEEHLPLQASPFAPESLCMINHACTLEANSALVESLVRDLNVS
jgi:hypothetical protein